MAEDNNGEWCSMYRGASELSGGYQSGLNPVLSEEWKKYEGVEDLLGEDK